MKVKPQFFENLAEQAGKIFSGEKSHTRTEIEQQFKSMLQSTFSKLELVSQDEFDDQMEVLAHTRKLVEDLSLQVKALEKQLASNGFSHEQKSNFTDKN